MFKKLQSSTTVGLINRFASWQRIIEYLYTCKDVEQRICVGCGTGVLIDKNNKRYRVTGYQTLDEVMGIVKQIRAVNG